MTSTQDGSPPLSRSRGLPNRQSPASLLDRPAVEEG